MACVAMVVVFPTVEYVCCYSSSRETEHVLNMAGIVAMFFSKGGAGVLQVDRMGYWSWVLWW